MDNYNWPYIATANRACSLLYSYIREHARGVWLLPVNVCPDVPLTFCLAKVPFQFVDINPQTLCIDIDIVESILKQKPFDYEGVLFVRTYGLLEDTSREFERIKNINKNIFIIDDRCLCIPERNPSFWNSDMLLYSTGHCKQIDLDGGGMAFYKEKNQYKIDECLFYDGTDEEVLYKKAFYADRTLNKTPTGWLKMDCYLSTEDYFAQIEDVAPKRLALRESINYIYTNNLPSSIQLSSKYQSWRFNIKVPSLLKNKILSELFENGLFASSHYRSVNRLFNNHIYPVSESLYQCVINLFNDQYYSQEKAQETCKIINKIIRSIN